VFVFLLNWCAFTLKILAHSDKCFRAHNNLPNSTRAYQIPPNILEIFFDSTSVSNVDMSSSSVSLKWCTFALLTLIEDDRRIHIEHDLRLPTSVGSAVKFIAKSAFVPLVDDVGVVRPMASTVSDPSSSSDLFSSEVLCVHKESDKDFTQSCGPFTSSPTGQDTVPTFVQTSNNILPQKENRPHNELDQDSLALVRPISANVLNPVFAPSSDVGDGRISSSTASDHLVSACHLFYDGAPSHKRTDHLLPTRVGSPTTHLFTFLHSFLIGNTIVLTCHYTVWMSYTSCTVYQTKLLSLHKYL